ncbi:MAG: sulfide/dihydroorotate dehydrogenase-like FAD/NAD-binding protein [Candidatus Eremiobacteraeota bacterium]|nr:sulfide/dihydroorotate dehydrogenase-like FAD/NAD-binding protein [Candidatus Eremiobacteraeota bacterium]
MPYKILKTDTLAPKNKLIVVDAPMVVRHARAGQFAILRIDKEGERIPLTLADWDSEKGTVTFIFQEVGKTSIQLGTLKEGDELLDVVGPLGNPTEVEKEGTIVTIGGGLGIAPLYPISRAFHANGNKVICIIGARNEELLFWEDKLDSISDELRICTDNGSKGRKGFVSDELKHIMYDEKIHIDRVFAIGPTIMMKVVADTTRPLEIPTVVSLNPIMVDGTGMCGACRVEVGEKTFFTCVDGPDFDAHKVNFDMLMKRQKCFVNEEKRSTEIYLNKCQCAQKS